MSEQKYYTKKDYVAKLKELELDDPNFEEKFNKINRSYFSKTHQEHDILRLNMNDTFSQFFRNPFKELTRVSDKINKIMYNDNLFIKNGEFDENKLDSVGVNTEQDRKGRSYYKYASSMTSYGNDGIRKSKSISRSETYDGKNKKVTQISRYQDGNKYVEEYLRPDGTIKKIEKRLNGNSLKW